MKCCSRLFFRKEELSQTLKPFIDTVDGLGPNVHSASSSYIFRNFLNVGSHSVVMVSSTQNCFASVPLYLRLRRFQFFSEHFNFNWELSCMEFLKICS